MRCYNAKVALLDGFLLFAEYNTLYLLNLPLILLGGVNHIAHGLATV